MNQTCIFDFLGKETDELYVQLSQVTKQSTETSIMGFSIRHTEHGFIEVSSDDIHECFTNIDDCYRYLLDLQFEMEGV